MSVTIEDDDELSVVPLEDYERVFAFPTSSVVSTHASCDSDGFWVTYRVETSPKEESLASLATGVRRRKKVVELRKVFVSTPPTGSLFSQRDIVWQAENWPYDKKSGGHKWISAVIPENRLEDFRRGIQCDASTEFVRSHSNLKGRGAGSMYVDKVFWHCICGPESNTVDADQKLAELMEGVRRRVSRKVGCTCRFETDVFTSAFKFLRYTTNAEVDVKLVRVRWPLADSGAPIWHKNHDVVPSWPASPEARKKLAELIRLHPSLRDAQILRLWRNEITENIMRASDMSRHVLNAHMARGKMKFPRDFYISVHDVKRLRQRSTCKVWKRHESEMASVFEWIMEDDGVAVIRFRNMEIAPARIQGRLVTEDDPFGGSPNRVKVTEKEEFFECLWCQYKSNDTDILEKHILSCVHRDIRDEDGPKKVAEYIKSCVAGVPKVSCWDEKKSSWWCARKLELQAKLSIMFDCIANNLSQILSPAKCSAPQTELAIVPYVAPEVNVEESEAKASKKQYLAYLCAEPDFSFDRRLEECQKAAIEEVFEEPQRDRVISQGVMSEAYTPVTVEDFSTLKDGEWLNDAVIDWQLQFLNKLERDRMQARGADVPRVYFFRIAVMNKLTNGWLRARVVAQKKRLHEPLFECGKYYNYEDVKGTLRKTRRRPFDAMDCDNLFFPVHWPGHWAAVVVSLVTRDVFYLDSMGMHEAGSRGMHLAEDVVQFMCDAMQERGREYTEKSHWRILQKNKLREKQFTVPEQVNNYDCGMFMLSFARHTLERPIDNSPLSEYKFRQHHMAHRRKVVAYEILSDGVQEACAERESGDGNATVATDEENTWESAPEPELAAYIRSMEESFRRDRCVQMRHHSVGAFYDCAPAKLPRIRVNGELRFVVKPFCLILMTPLMAHWMWKYGHDAGVQMDSTFGTNKAKYSLFTVVVRHDSAGMGLPGAWIITSDERTETIAYCLRAVRESLRTFRPTNVTGDWTPNAFIVDCALSELAAVRQVFGRAVQVFWCHWHVLQAMKRRSMRVTLQHRSEIMNKSHSLVRDYDNTDVKSGMERWYSRLKAFLEFCTSHDDESVRAYGRYFSNQWVPNYRLWAKAFRFDGRYGIDTTSTAESYHNFIKSMAYADGSRWLKQRRMDWLCHFMLNDVLNAFVVREHVINIKLPEAVLQSHRTTLMEYGKLLTADATALKISNQTEVFSTAEKKNVLDTATVVLRCPKSDKEEVHEVGNLDLLRDSALQRYHQLVTCSCVDGQQGKLCLPKLHAMTIANKAYTLGALGCDENTKRAYNGAGDAEQEPRIARDDFQRVVYKSTDSSKTKALNADATQTAEVVASLKQLARVPDQDFARKHYLNIITSARAIRDAIPEPAELVTDKDSENASPRDTAVGVQEIYSQSDFQCLTEKENDNSTKRRRSVTEIIGKGNTKSREGRTTRFKK